MLARDKALTKKVLAYHGILIPHFMVCGAASHAAAERPALSADREAAGRGRVGRHRAGVGRARRRGAGRPHPFIHDKFSTDAIVEEFIDGRELYIGVMGNEQAASALPPIEMVFDEPRRRRSHRDLQGQVERQVPREPGHREHGRHRSVEELIAAAVGRGGADVQGGGAARLRPHRRATGARRRHLRRRGQPQSRIPADGEDLARGRREEGGLLRTGIDRGIAEMAIPSGTRLASLL